MTQAALRHNDMTPRKNKILAKALTARSGAREVEAYTLLRAFNNIC